MSAAVLTLTPNLQSFADALDQVTGALHAVAAQLGPAPAGLLGRVAAIAAEAAKGRVIEVNIVNAEGQITEALAPPTERSEWTVTPEAGWSVAADQVMGCLLDAATVPEACPEDENLTRERQVFGIELLTVCYELESKGGATD